MKRSFLFFLNKTFPDKYFVLIKPLTLSRMYHDNWYFPLFEKKCSIQNIIKIKS